MKFKKACISIGLMLCFGCATFVGEVKGKPVVHENEEQQTVCAVVKGDLWDVENYTHKEENCWCFMKPFIMKTGNLVMVSVYSNPLLCNQE